MSYMGLPELFFNKDDFGIKWTMKVWYAIKQRNQTIDISLPIFYIVSFLLNQRHRDFVISTRKRIILGIIYYQILEHWNCIWRICRSSVLRTSRYKKFTSFYIVSISLSLSLSLSLSHTHTHTHTLTRNYSFPF